MRVSLCVLLYSLLFFSVKGQILDLAQMEYTYIPGKNANYDYSSFDVEVNYPFRLKNERYFFVGLKYSDISFNFEEEVDSYQKSAADNFKSVDLNLTYTFLFSENWRFGLQISPSINSNFHQALSTEDFLMNAVALFVRSKKKEEGAQRDSRLIVGLGYSSVSRLQAPIPFVNYHRQFHDRWSYTVGVPYSNLQYHLSEKSRLKIHAEGDTFNGHIQQGVVVNDLIFGDRLRILLILAGLRYEYKPIDHLELYVNLLRTIASNVQIRDGITNVFEQNLDRAMFYNVGLRFKI